MPGADPLEAGPALLDADPVLLDFDDRFSRELRKARLLQNHLEVAVRERGHSSVREVTAIVREPDGRLSIVPKHPGLHELIDVLRAR